MMVSSVFLVLNFAVRGYWLEKIETTKRLNKEAILWFFLTLLDVTPWTETFVFPPRLHLASSQCH